MVFRKKSWRDIALYLFKYSWKRYLMVIFATVILIYIYTVETKRMNFIPQEQIYSNSIPEVFYLINTSKCKIPDSDPFNADIVNFLVEEKPYKCSELDLLTYIDKTNGAVTLNVNKTLLKAYSSMKISCCYSNITRINYEVRADNEIRLTDCIHFQDSINLNFPYIKVRCYTKLRDVYTNVHATTLPTPRRVNASSNHPKFSVLMLGIDSISKSNLKRTMPKTYDFLENRMYNLRGYNKIGDNTFPNLMAVLSGYSVNQLSNICNISVKLNKCQLIWDKFRQFGYVTAYAEDECDISTYNFDRPGFLEEPTDFYYHPYFLAAEKLPVKKRHSMTYCAGPETSGERILNAAKDFVISFGDVPSFGLFWTNSFSHDNINMPAVMDEAFFKLLSDPRFFFALNETILVLFSDHGFRFGDIRYTYSGWLEERLPFIYIYIPPKFQNLYPRKFNNFLINTERLTTPYDLHNTLQDILGIGNSSYKIDISRGCPKCSSLFSIVPENRTCEDASIDQHWCTCKGHTYIDTGLQMVQLVAQFVIEEVNNLIKSLPNGAKCSAYSLDKVRSAGVSEPYTNNKNQTVNYYLVMVETKPPAIFEATVEACVQNGKEQLRLLGDISRIDRYAPVTQCINGGMLKKYCYCANFVSFLRSLIPFL